jgi:hypothetical protein
MSARLATDVKVRALLRRVSDVGGSAMVLARGDATAGAVLVVVLESAEASVWERSLGPDGHSTLRRTGPDESTEQAVTDYWQRRRARDPDLWVVELSVAGAERFAAETMGVD